MGTYSIEEQRRMDSIDMTEGRRGLVTMVSITLEEYHALKQIRDENYSDLLDQMDEAWGKGPFEVCSAEVHAFLESRIVHKPATRLREEIERLKQHVVDLNADFNEFR